MTKTKITVVASFVLSLWAGPASAGFDRVFPVTSDFFMTVGYKLWLANWQTGNFTFTSQEGSNSASYGEQAAASIPSVSLKYKRVFLSASMLSTGDYDFPVYTDMISLTGGGGASTLLEHRTTASRDEVDANLGVSVNPSLAFSVGYKGITQDFRMKTRSLSGVATVPQDDQSKTKYSGPTLGVLVGAPLGAGFSAYGNFVGGILSMKFEPSSGTEDEPDAVYEGAEIGLAYKAKNTPFSFTLGYKYQVIDNTTNDKNFKDQRVIDLTRGFIFGLNIFF